MVFIRKVTKPCIIIFSICILLCCLSGFKISNLHAEFNDDDDFVQQSTETTSEDENSSGETSSNEEQHEICNFLSDNVKNIFYSITDKKSVSEDINSIYQRLNSKYSNSEYLTDMADASILSLFINSGILNNDKFLASEHLLKILEKFKNNNKSNYDYDKYASMTKDSQSFAGTGKKTGSCEIENIVSLIYDKKLNNCPIKYDDNILISLDDLLNISDLPYNIEYMDNNSTIIIKFENNILEIESGNNQVFLNDVRSIMKVPVLNVKGVIYVPIDLESLLGCQVVEYNGTVVIY